MDKDPADQITPKNRLFTPLLISALQPPRNLSEQFTIGSLLVKMHFHSYYNMRGQRNKPHLHSHHEICLVASGKGVFDHGEDTCRLELGDLFLAQPGVTHEIISDRREHLVLTYFGFDIAKPQERLPGDSLIPEERLVNRFEESHAVLATDALDLLHHCVSLASLSGEHDDGARALRQSIMRTLVLETCRRTTSSIRLDTYLTGSETDPRLSLALRFMEDNLYRLISVPELARQAMASERTLVRLFRKNVGRGPMKEFKRRRMVAAARRLVETRPEISVARVGHQYGYEDTSQFIRDFKQIWNLTPAQFRAREARPRQRARD